VAGNKETLLLLTSYHCLLTTLYCERIRNTAVSVNDNSFYPTAPCF